MIIKVNAQTTLVFDLDDTLYKEIDFLKSAYMEIAQKLDPVHWKQTYAHMFALYRQGENVFKFLEKYFKADIKGLIAIYRNHIPDICLDPNISVLFDTILKNKGKLALLTDGRSLTQRNKIKVLQLERWFDEIIISEELGTEKPSVANFKAVEDKCKADTYYYIADNLKKDFVTPNDRGWGTIGLIDNGLNIHFYPEFYDLPEHRPHEFITALNEIEIIGK